MEFKNSIIQVLKPGDVADVTTFLRRSAFEINNTSKIWDDLRDLVTFRQV